MPGATQRVTISLDGIASGLAVDDARRMVWVPVVRDDHSAVLYGDSFDGRLVAIAGLPRSQYIGIFTRAVADPRGRVWVSGDHLIARYDPVAKRTTSVTFPQRVRGENPDAFSDRNAQAGTWVSSFAVSGGRLYVARANIPFISVYDADTLAPITTIPMPPAYAGSVALAVTGAGDLVAAGDMAHGNAATIAVHPADGTHHVVGKPVEGLGTTSSGTVLLATAAGCASYPSSSSRYVASVRGLTECVPSGDGSVVAGWDSRGGTVVRWRGGSSQVLVPARTPIVVANPLGQPVHTFAVDKPSAVSVSDDGTLWEIGHDNRELRSIPPGRGVPPPPPPQPPRSPWPTGIYTGQNAPSGMSLKQTDVWQGLIGGHRVAVHAGTQLATGAGELVVARVDSAGQAITTRRVLHQTVPGPFRVVQASGTSLTIEGGDGATFVQEIRAP